MKRKLMGILAGLVVTLASSANVAFADDTVATYQPYCFGTQLNDDESIPLRQGRFHWMAWD